MKLHGLTATRPVRETGATASGWVTREYVPDAPARLILDVDLADVPRWRELIEKESTNGEG